jgi:hypothetical protein
MEYFIVIEIFLVKDKERRSMFLRHNICFLHWKQNVIVLTVVQAKWPFFGYCFLFISSSLSLSQVITFLQEGVVLWFWNCVKDIWGVMGDAWRLGCPTLLDMHQITPSKKKVIPIYKILDTASFSAFATCAKHTKDFQNL